jgi:hypothetical protein
VSDGRRALLRGLAVLAGVVLVAGACDDAGGDSSSDAGDPGADAPIAATAGNGVGACFTAPARGEAGAIRLADATDDLGLTEPLVGMHGHAMALGDVDGDGWTDVFVGSFADRPPREYRQRGADGPSPDRLLLGGPGGFRVDDSFPELYGRTSGAAFADLDNDGRLDLVVARNVRSDVDRGTDPSVVLRNTGEGFELAGVLDDERTARSVGILDVDGDGRLDVFLVEDEWGGGSSALFRNAGGFEFEDITDDAGLPSDVHGLGVATSDLTGDGLPELFVSGSNRLFVNVGAEFEEADDSVFEWETFGPEDSVGGVAVGDVNRDGRPDLVVGHHFNSTVDDDREAPVRLYLNTGANDRGHPRFRDVTEKAGLVALPTKAPHLEIVDIDSDGWPDVLTSASADDGADPAVFRNLGAANGTVPRFEAPDGLGDDQYWVAGGTFDADHDGRVDVLLVEWEPSLPSLLLRSTAATGHWVAVEAGGAAEVGARVDVFEAGGLGDPERLLGSRPIVASTGYSSGSESVARFGLGDRTAVDLLVRPPAGGDGRGSAIEVRRARADRSFRVGGDC